jgi:hypothetical protein
MNLVKATDLDQWADRMDARGKFPLLLRKLLFASGAKLNHLDFPTEEGIQSGGWDGKLEASSGNLYIPDGSSVWELSTNARPRDKANNDYQKRLKNPGDVDPTATTYVAVSLRRWSSKQTWAQEKNAKGFWKQVRAYDAEDIAAWLDLAPAVHIWLSRLIGKLPHGVDDLENFWVVWARATQPPALPELLLASRESVAAEVRKWLESPPSVLTLQAETAEEATAFLAAVLYGEPESTHLHRGVLVDDPSAWAVLAAAIEPLILVPRFADRQQVIPAAERHHVLVPIGRDEPATRGTLILPRIRRDQAKASLEKMGVEESQLEPLATLARQSLNALRRKLSQNPSLLIPAWAKSEKGQELLPALLSGRWEENNPADCEVVARLAGMSYAEYEKVLVRWSHTSDPPLRKVGTTWLVVAREDSWILLSRYLTHNQLRVFEEVVCEVLGEVDPKYELEVYQRWAASVCGKKLKHSGHLREGLAQTLALLGAYSSAYPLADQRTGQEWADYITHKLLQKAVDWQAWASLSWILQLLAEASPDVFLEAVERGLHGDTPILVNLFTDTEHDLWGSSPHTGLLWALELLAWSPDYLGRAAMLLATLARLDPGGKTANRPINSLREIFLTWRPQTKATAEQRLKVLDTLQKREPEIAWTLLHSILTSKISHQTASPRYRDWGANEGPKLTYAELFRLISEIISRLVADAGANAKRWCVLVELIANVDTKHAETLLEALQALEPDTFDEKGREEVWGALRGMVARHLNYPDAKWAFSRERVGMLEQVYQRFTPSDPVAQHAWVFTDTTDFPKAGYEDWEARNRAIQEARQQAVEELFELGGLGLVLDLLERAQKGWEVGRCLGKSRYLTGEEFHLLEEHFGSENLRRRGFALGFLNGRMALNGPDWLETFCADPRGLKWPPAHRVEIYLLFSPGKVTWDLLGRENPVVEQLYWQQLNYWSLLSLPEAELSHGISKLLEHKRYGCLIDLLAALLHGDRPRPDPTLIADVLEKALTDEASEPIQWGSLSYDLTQLLDYLAASSLSEERVALIEWRLLPLFHAHEYTPKVLQRVLANQPELFVEILCWAYNAEGEEPRELSEEEHRRAERAYLLLFNWRRPPGFENGSVDAVALHSWVSRAREMALAKGRDKVADKHIGQVLIGYPIGSDGVWPHEAVRDLIEKLASQELERGIDIGLFNSRGVTWRAIDEGGQQERDIAERYAGYAKALSDAWPRTAALMRRISELYEAEAKRHDNETELEQDLWR